MPCSGTGTWRRNPDLKLTTTRDSVDALVDEQQMIMQQAQGLVRPGGWLIYATCSVLTIENEDQVAYFLKTYPDFSVVSAEEILLNMNNSDAMLGALRSYNEMGMRMSTFQHRTDGFYGCVLKKKG